MHKPDADRTECSYAIAGSTIIGIGPLGDASTWFDDPDVTEVVRMPVVSVEHVHLYDRWPGRDAALALISAEGRDHG